MLPFLSKTNPRRILAVVSIGDEVVNYAFRAVSRELENGAL